jgi:hypothetical protein
MRPTSWRAPDGAGREARTPGYETYEGLGWYGALVQRRS